MADDQELLKIIEAMEAAGESEDDIAAVIKEYKPTAAPTALTKTQAEESVPHAMLRGFGEGVVGGVTGVRDSIIPAAIGAAKGILSPFVSFAESGKPQAGGIYRALTQPLEKTGSELADLGQGIKDQAHTALEAMDVLTHPVRTLSNPMAATNYTSIVGKAGSDPQAAGKEIGGGSLSLPMAAAGAKYIPMAPKPVARMVGGTMASAGKLGKWSLTITGAHRIVMGDFAPGAALMAGPQALIKTGTALQRWGTPEGAAASSAASQLLKQEMDLKGVDGVVDPAVISRIEGELHAAQEALKIRRAKSKLDVDTEAIIKDQKALNKIETQLNAAKKNAVPPDLRDPFAQKPLYQQMDDLPETPARPATRGSDPIVANPNEPIPAVKARQAREAAEEAKARANAERLALIEEMKAGKEATSPSILESISAKGPSGESVRASRSFRDPVAEESATAVAEDALLRQQIKKFSPKMTDADVDKVIAASKKQEVPGPAKVTSRKLPGDESIILSGADKPASGITVRKLGSDPLGGLDSKTKIYTSQTPKYKGSGEMSATPGYSVTDMQVIGKNPKLNYKQITAGEELKVLKDRARRQGVHIEEYYSKQDIIRALASDK